MLIVDKPMPTNCYDCALDCCWDEGTKPEEYAEKRKPNCPIKGEISEIELMHLAIFFREEERAFVARNIAAERKDDE